MVTKWDCQERKRQLNINANLRVAKKGSSKKPSNDMSRVAFLFSDIVFISDHKEKRLDFCEYLLSGYLIRVSLILF